MKNDPIFGPNYLENWWQKAGTDELKPIFAQVATVGENQEPQVRTVHVRYLKEKQCLAINTHTDSKKWEALTKNPQLAGCYFDPSFPRQIQWKGAVELITGKNGEEKKFLDTMWSLLDVNVRISYWLKEGCTEKDPNIRCPTLGAILCKPTSWEIYEINVTNHLESRNTHYFLKGENWETEEASSLAPMAKSGKV